MTACAEPSKLAGSFRAIATCRASASASMLSDMRGPAPPAGRSARSGRLPASSRPAGPGRGRRWRRGAEGVGQRRARVDAGLPAACRGARADPRAVDGGRGDGCGVAGRGVGGAPATRRERTAEQRAVDDDPRHRGAGRHGGEHLGGQVGDRGRARVGLGGGGAGERGVAAADEDDLTGRGAGDDRRLEGVRRVEGGERGRGGEQLRGRGGRGRVGGVEVEQDVLGRDVHDLRRRHRYRGRRR